jgi:hypothetical protein
MATQKLSEYQSLSPQGSEPTVWDGDGGGFGATILEKTNFLVLSPPCGMATFTLLKIFSLYTVLSPPCGMATLSLIALA